MTDSRRNLLIGLGIGLAAGGTISGVTCWQISKKRENRKAREAVKTAVKASYGEGYNDGLEDGLKEVSIDGDKALQAAYMRGVDEATREAQKWMDEHLIQAESDDPDAILKAIEAHKRASEGSERIPVPEKPEALKTALEGQTEAFPEGSEKAEKVYTEADYGVKNTDAIDTSSVLSDVSTRNPDSGVKPSTENVTEIFRSSSDKSSGIQYSGREYRIQVRTGQTFAYPIELFCGREGRYAETQIRQNLMDYEHDPLKLKLVWEAMGWGLFVGDSEDGIPSAEQMEDWNISIEDVNKMLADADLELGDEPEEATLARERYLDEVERYRSHPEEAPRIISKQEFDEENHLEKIWVDYYDVDNVFLDPSDNDRPVDATIAFGVADGKALFMNAVDHDDPDVVHVKHFGQNIVAEITRYHKASTGLMDGSAYINGSSGVG